jgi:hypothetical protein
VLKTNGSAVMSWVDQPAAGVTDHGALTGLSDDDHSIYALLAGRSGGQTLKGDTASGGALTLMSTNHATKGNIVFNVASRAIVNAAGDFSNAAGQTGAEKFGAGASIGTSDYSTAIGGAAVASGAGATTLGYAATSTGAQGVAVGNQATANAVYAVSLGFFAAAGFASSIAIGRGSATTAANQGVIGATGADATATGAIGELFLGGVVSTTAYGVRFQSCGGSGTDNAGGSLKLAPGKSTGSATPATIILQGTTAGSTGTTAQTLVDFLTIGGSLAAVECNTSNIKSQAKFGYLEFQSFSLGNSWLGENLYSPGTGSFKYRGNSYGTLIRFYQDSISLWTCASGSAGADVTPVRAAGFSASVGNTLDVNTTLAEAVNLILGTSTGTKLGTAASQKLGFWNATPVIQQASANQTAITDSTGGGVGDATIVDVGVAPTQANVNDNFAKIAKLLNRLRLDLVTTGIIKGAA